MKPESLIGTWTLVEWTIRYADGRTTMPFGPAPRGQILYTADGHLHHAGRWYIEGEDVIHDVDLALNPLLIDPRQVRRCELEGDRLELRAEEAVGDSAELRVHRILWRRAVT